MPELAQAPVKGLEAPPPAAAVNHSAEELDVGVDQRRLKTIGQRFDQVSEYCRRSLPRRLLGARQVNQFVNLKRARRGAPQVLLTTEGSQLRNTPGRHSPRMTRPSTTADARPHQA